jgi:hypothetical protein
VPAARIVKAVDVFEDRYLSFPAGFPVIAPDQFRLDGFEERRNCGVVITITFSAHRYLEAMLAQDFLVVVRTILRPTIRVVNAALGGARNAMAIVSARIARSRFIRLLTVQPMTRRGCKSRIDVCDVASPLLVGCIGCKVTIQQVGRDIEFMIAVPLSADCFAIACRAVVVTVCLRVRTTDLQFWRINLPTRRWPTSKPISFSSSVIRGRS